MDQDEELVVLLHYHTCLVALYVNQNMVDDVGFDLYYGRERNSEELDTQFCHVKMEPICQDLEDPSSSVGDGEVDLAVRNPIKIEHPDNSSEGDAVCHQDINYLVIRPTSHSASTTFYRKSPKEDRRGKNFNEREKEALINITRKYKHVLENKITNKCFNAKKTQAWQKIEVEFNSMGIRVNKRSVDQLRTCYENLKRKMKKDLTNEKVELYKTGGGAPKISGGGSISEAMLDIMSDTIHPEQNPLDGSIENYSFLLQEAPTASADVMGLVKGQEIIITQDEKHLMPSTTIESPSLALKNSPPVKTSRKKRIRDVYDEVSNTTSGILHKNKMKEDYTQIIFKKKMEILNLELDFKKELYSLELKLKQRELYNVELSIKQKELDNMAI